MNRSIDNPFKMPADSDIFMLREKEKQQKLKVIFQMKYKIRKSSKNEPSNIKKGKRNE